MKQISLGLLFITIFLTSAFAQKVSIDNVRKSALRTSDAIRQGADVKGYYFFYISDKIDKKTNQYSLRILDDKLNLLKEITFQDSKHVTVLESSFNGTDLIFLLYNDDELTFEYQVYGADGKRKPYTYNRQLSKKERRFLESTYLAMNDEEDTYKGLYPIEGKGFISNMPSREDKDYTFQVDYFSTEKRKQWTFIPTEDAKKSAGDYLGTYNGVVYFEVLKFNSLMDQKPDSYILGLDLETGRKLFEKPTDGKFRFYPATLSVLNGQAYLYGEYFDVDANIMKDKSQGFAFWGIDQKGKVTSEKYNSWELQIGKYMNVSSKGKIEDFGYMYLHNIVQAADGSIYAIGEGYKKAASALGIASKILSGGRSSGVSTVKVKVTDMAMIQFDRDFNVKGMKIYPKNANNIELQGGMEFVSTALLGKMIKYNFGGFDYRYTQSNADLSSFSVCYSDYERSKDYKGGVFKSITYSEGKVTEDRINTKSDASISWVLPGRQGQVLLIDYYRKDKRLEAHFEKLN
ncbi:MAG: hypothetical protein HZA79_06005 [Sphingobacteriales bacterium]|nr:hypothetical protein [Sphingobacteriales bacterium]